MYTDFDRYQEECDYYIGQNIITGITKITKKGKEAAVLCCKAHESLAVEYLAVKLYKESKFRNFKKDNEYMAGKVWDKRFLKNIKRIKDVVWVETEYNVLERLHEAGANVPKPYAYNANSIVMEFIGHDTVAAPLLTDISPGIAEAESLFETIINEIDLMLFNETVHSDLSAYNILYHKKEPVIIDFPQAVDPRSHMDAGKLFLRDINNICEYFIAQGVACNADELARDLWKQYYPVEF